MEASKTLQPSENATNQFIHKMRHKHVAIMEALVAFPQLTQKDLSERLNISETRLSVILKSPVFQMAYSEFRRRHQDKVSDKAIEATLAALNFNKELIENRDVGIELRQQSARDILELGHAKAVEKKASLNASVDIPMEDLQALGLIAKELGQPFTPTRFLKKAEEGVIDAEEGMVSSEAGGEIRDSV